MTLFGGNRAFVFPLDRFGKILVAFPSKISMSSVSVHLQLPRSNRDGRDGRGWNRQRRNTSLRTQQRREYIFIDFLVCTFHAKSINPADDRADWWAESGTPISLFLRVHERYESRLRTVDLYYL